MTHILVMAIVFVALSGCVIVSSGHVSDEPGNSGAAPGQVEKTAADLIIAAVGCVITV